MAGRFQGSKEGGVNIFGHFKFSLQSSLSRCELERMLSEMAQGTIPAIRLTAFHHCEGLVGLRLLTFEAEYALESRTCVAE